jgi:AraC-like DNA-binding protein
MMRTDIHIGFFDFFIFLGVFQGLLLSWFFIKNGMGDRKANLYQGFLLLLLSLTMFEELLNNTGYIVQLLPISNFAEPFNFAVAPLFYLYVRSSLNPGDKGRVWVHFLISMFWLVYLVLHFLQPDELKYNNYIYTKHPDWGYIDVDMPFSDDPLYIRHFINELTLVSFLVYMALSIMTMLRKFKSLGQGVFSTDNETLIVLRNTTFHFLAIIAIFVITKLYFGLGSDIGGYWIASYISLMIYTTSYQVLNRSEFFNQPHSFLDFPVSKYRKSSLSDVQKEAILSRIKIEMEENRYFANNLASLSGLAKQINETTHHVSQVINEKSGMNFFELLAGYRVEYAKKLIREDKASKLTVEELAEQVGYNSKSSFNSAFKKHASKTPSEYRKEVNNT